MNNGTYCRREGSPKHLGGVGQAQNQGERRGEKGEVAGDPPES